MACRDNLILLGDFNLSSSSSLNQINAIADLLSLRQIVSHPTHFSTFGSPSLIDFVFVPSSLSHTPCNILPPLSNSDHFSLFFSLPPSPSISSRRIWLYDSGNFALANKLLSSIPWSSTLKSDVNFAWLTHKFAFLQIIHLTIPSKLVYAPPHPPWITRSFLSCIKCRNFLLKRPKSSNSPLHWSSYHSFRNETLSYIRFLK